MVRLGMTTPTLTYLVRSAIRNLREKQPDIELVLSLAASRRLVEYVREGEIDLAIVSLPVDPTGLKIQIVYEEEVVGIVPDAKVAPGTAMTPERLSSSSFYVQGNPDAQMTIALEWFRSAGLTPQAWIEVETLEACCAAAGAGLGVTIAPAGMVEKVAEPDQIFKLDPPINRRLAIICRADVDLAKQGGIVRDALAAHLAGTTKAAVLANHSAAVAQVTPPATLGKLRSAAAV